MSSAILFVASEVYLVAFLAAALLTWRSTRPARALGRPLAVQVPVLLLIAAWAALPYLGIRTSGVFTMFSGLRTEGIFPNHLFMPSLHVAGWATDLVIIEPRTTRASTLRRVRRLGCLSWEFAASPPSFPALVVEGTLNGAHVTFGTGDRADPP